MNPPTVLTGLAPHNVPIKTCRAFGGTPFPANRQFSLPLRIVECEQVGRSGLGGAQPRGVLDQGYAEQNPRGPGLSNLPLGHGSG